MKKQLHVISLGCTKNLVDTEVMLGSLGTYALTDEPHEADVIIVNTCGFIEAAKSESIQTVLEVHAQRKQDSILVMAGCLSERYKDELQKELSEVDIFTGVGDYAKIAELIESKQSRFSDEVFLINEETRAVTGSHYHAYVKIAEGCNQQCSFCAIPGFKGKLHSRSVKSIVAEVHSLCKKGYFDFSFIAQDSSSYLFDQGVRDGLIQLIHAVDAIKEVKSARILYLYPSTTSAALIDAIGESKTFHNYFDMPLQHSDDAMLKRMKRGLGKTGTIALLEKMKALPDAFIRTSFIVGHPGESEEAFNALCEFAQHFGFDRINVFEYSDEEETLSYEMEDKVNDDLIGMRAEVLGNIARTCEENSLDALISKEIDIVIDGPSDEHEYLLSARALQWAPDIDGEIYINDNETGHELITGTIYKAKITERAGTTLLATVVCA